MATVAEQLRSAREAQKLTVNQIADITKIRTDHIRALEEGNFDIFVAPVYIRGFVRSYAGLLKLNVPHVMATLDGELSQTEKFSEPPPLSKQQRGALDFVMLKLSRLNWRVASVALGGILVFVVVAGIYFAWRSFRSRDPLANLPPAVYRHTGGDSGETLPLTNPPARRP